MSSSKQTEVCPSALTKPSPMRYIKSVSSPWFEYIQQGSKTVEGRLFVGDFKHIKAEDIITFTNRGMDVKTRVIQVRRYGTFEEMLRAETLGSCLPGVETVAAGISIYRQFYSQAQEIQHGVLAVHIEIQ